MPAAADALPVTVAPSSCNTSPRLYPDEAADVKEAEADLSLADDDNEEDDAALTLPVPLLWLFAVEVEEEIAG